MKDNIFASKNSNITKFAFDEKVTSVFSDMIKRSVPGYENVILMIGLLAERFVKDNTNCYDLGCSLGASAISMQKYITAKNCHIHAIDTSEPMINKATELVSIANEEYHNAKIELHCKDITNFRYENASMMVLNFTLQFLELEQRRAMLEKIYASLNKGGCLVLSEKITFNDKETNELFIDIYHKFKMHNGYSEMEVSQKRNALENVLIPETLQTHKERLLDIGFEKVELWFQCFNFMSIVAFK
ncbi:carboxy-S-adenosyl-L-methionine synthase CmoA [Lentisphaerota bacterium WC36G]|nr:carboxy-S-adenosyl-L-methionine synthase CmoA [Lentisphaerae bacterium WC36]